MGVLSSLNDTSNKAIDIGEQYIEKSQEYYKLKIFQQLTASIGMCCKIAILGSLVLLVLTLLIVAGTIALGKYLGSVPYACLSIALCVFLVCIIVYKLRNIIDSLLIKKIAKHYFD